MSGPGWNKDCGQEIVTKITLLRLTETPRIISIAHSAHCCLIFCSAIDEGAGGTLLVKDMLLSGWGGGLTWLKSYHKVSGSGMWYMRKGDSVGIQYHFYKNQRLK
jgi:hypothetical protein